MEENKGERKIKIEKRDSVFSTKFLSACLSTLDLPLFIGEGRNYADLNQFGI